MEGSSRCGQDRLMWLISEWCVVMACSLEAFFALCCLSSVFCSGRQSQTIRPNRSNNTHTMCLIAVCDQHIWTSQSAKSVLIREPECLSGIRLLRMNGRQGSSRCVSSSGVHRSLRSGQQVCNAVGQCYGTETDECILIRRRVRICSDG